MKLATVLVGAAVLGGGALAWRWWQNRPHVGAWALPPGRSYRLTVRSGWNAGVIGAQPGMTSELVAMGVLSGFAVDGAASPDGRDPYVWRVQVTPNPGSANGGAIADTPTVQVIGVTAV